MKTGEEKKGASLPAMTGAMQVRRSYAAKGKWKAGRRGTASPDDLSQERRREWRVRTRPELNERELLLVVDVDVDHAGACTHAPRIFDTSMVCRAWLFPSAADRQFSPTCMLRHAQRPGLLTQHACIREL